MSNPFKKSTMALRTIVNAERRGFASAQLQPTSGVMASFLQPRKTPKSDHQPPRKTLKSDHQPPRKTLTTAAMAKSKQQKKQEELLKTLGDFTSKENWDQFFTIRGGDDAFEWYAEWPQLKDVLLPHLSPPTPGDEGGESSSSVGKAAAEVRVLVPGCGNSKISECLYDFGFRNITNIDFSKVVILDMLKRNVRSRPEMKWRVMDMTNMQAHGVHEVLDFENNIRSKHSDGDDVIYSLEDLKIGAKVNLAELNPSQRIQLKLGEPGVSRFTYKAVLLDAPQNSGPFPYHCGVFPVPKIFFKHFLSDFFKLFTEEKITF